MDDRSVMDSARGDHHYAFARVLGAALIYASTGHIACSAVTLGTCLGLMQAEVGTCRYRLVPAWKAQLTASIPNRQGNTVGAFSPPLFFFPFYCLSCLLYCL